MLASVRHPCIVNMLGGSLRPPHVFLVEELCAQSLDARLHRPGAPPLTCREMLKYAVDVAQGLQYLHERSPPIVHRGGTGAECCSTSRARWARGDYVGLCWLGRRPTVPYIPATAVLLHRCSAARRQACQEWGSALRILKVRRLTNAPCAPVHRAPADLKPGNVLLDANGTAKASRGHRGGCHSHG